MSISKLVDLVVVHVREGGFFEIGLRLPVRKRKTMCPKNPDFWTCFWDMSKPWTDGLKLFEELSWRPIGEFEHLCESVTPADSRFGASGLIGAIQQNRATQTGFVARFENRAITAQLQVMASPTEYKTAQSRILAYSQEIGWTQVPREEAERRRGFDPEGVTPEQRARPSLSTLNKLSHQLMMAQMQVHDLDLNEILGRAGTEAA